MVVVIFAALEYASFECELMVSYKVDLLLLFLFDMLIYFLREYVCAQVNSCISDRMEPN